MTERPYPKPECVVAHERTVLQVCRTKDKIIEVPRELPCNVIAVHGVNDVGTAYCEVEEGLCAGLEKRLQRRFKPATYRMPSKDDKNKVLADPDAVFFKRKVDLNTDSPIIPFYWGFREVQDESGTLNGQKVDRNGNRLDKDLSKGGGPFGNATSSLPDMWNRGTYSPVDAGGDPIRPLRTGPGRLYMVLAARRLACLIAMIRKYEPKDTVNIVAHSQGCLLSLLAQAFLMEMGERTADTLILTHPPYSLEEEMSRTMKTLSYFRGDRDPAMNEFYGLIDGRQTVSARLQTLVNIVTGVAHSRTNTPVFASINERDSGGMVHGLWKPEADRDNRGKVYLYFCPEDMTVALDNMRGIGWQGVPDFVAYRRHVVNGTKRRRSIRSSVLGTGWNDLASRNALGELGESFRQRVFTAKKRTNSASTTPVQVLVGQAPHDFVLRLPTEDDHAHVAADGRTLRTSLPIADPQQRMSIKPEDRRAGIRAINAEALKSPFDPEIRGNQVDRQNIPAHSMLSRVSLEDRGPSEAVDPIDAAIAVTGTGGIRTWWEDIPASYFDTVVWHRPGVLADDERKQVQDIYNKHKLPGVDQPDDQYTILSAKRRTDNSITAQVQEPVNTARRRWQNEYSPKSFHSVIFGSRKNHQHVTAYDLSIGSGKAVSDRAFYAYLCAVADWRIKNVRDKEISRPGILTLGEFTIRFASYLGCEPAWRKELILGNAEYYSSGLLPSTLPLLTGKLWKIIISETTDGARVTAST